MSSIIIAEDIRSVKTKKALYAAMFALLRKHSFKKMTIKGICEEALISRAAFYAHFIDKYDLLKHWMPELWPIAFDGSVRYAQIEKTVNSRVQENAPVLKNLVYDADSETISILFDFIISTINLTLQRDESGDAFPQNVVLANFFAGGIISYFLWQVDNKFPSDVPPMNRYLYDMIYGLQGWQSK